VPFVQGVIDLYRGLLADNRDLIVHAYETWGFGGLSAELIDGLTIWARFIYGPLLDDREREIAEGTTPGDYGRREAFTVHRILREKGPVKVPREHGVGRPAHLEGADPLQVLRLEVELRPGPLVEEVGADHRGAVDVRFDPLRRRPDVGERDLGERDVGERDVGGAVPGGVGLGSRGGPNLGSGVLGRRHAGSESRQATQSSTNPRS
jgi:hypothetical protein